MMGPGNRWRGVWLSLFFLVPICSPASAQTQSAPVQQTAPIRVDVSRVNVGVVVTDAHGGFVGGLQRQDFHLFDNGVEQPLTNFAAIDEPAQVVLFIEAGPAVYLLESGHLRAAHTFLEGLSPGDRVSVVKYAEAALPVSDFNADKLAAYSALEQLRFNLGFGTLNLASSLNTLFGWLDKIEGKKTVVLLSTGVDTSPANAWGTIETRLKTSDVRVLAVSLGGELRNTKPKGKKPPLPDKSATAETFAEADRVLRGIAEATGGHAYFPQNTKQFAEVYAEIAQLVRHEYSLAFAPPARDGELHSIEVRVDVSPRDAATPPGSGYRVDHRRAYVAPEP